MSTIKHDTMIRSSITLCLLLALSGFVYGQSEPAVAAVWKTLDEADFSISYPSDWELDQSGNLGVSFFLFSPLSDSTDDFRENINLLIQDLTGYDLDLDQYTELSKEQIKAMMTDGEILLNEKLGPEGKEYQRIIYTGTQGNYDLQFEQFYWVIGQEAYVLTLTCKRGEFERYQEMGEKILRSFVLK